MGIDTVTFKCKEDCLNRSANETWTFWGVYDINLRVGIVVGVGISNSDADSDTDSRRRHRHRHRHRHRLRRRKMESQPVGEQCP